jgi:DNA-binding XRE family transcriptional regulator
MSKEPHFIVGTDKQGRRKVRVRKLSETSKQEVLDRLSRLSLPDRVRTVRGLFGLSQYALADLIKVNRSTVVGWERDVDHPRYYVPGARARASMAWYFGLPAVVFTPDFGARVRSRLPDTKEGKIDWSFLEDEEGEAIEVEEPSGYEDEDEGEDEEGQGPPPPDPGVIRIG